MPTAIPGGEKSAFVAIVALHDTNEAIYVNTNMNNYEDIPTILLRQDDYLAYNNYLLQLMSVFTDSALVNAHIYLNKTLNTPVTSPLVLIGTTTTDGVLMAANNKTLFIANNSVIDNITTAINISLDKLIIGPNTIVTLLDGTAINSQVGEIDIRCLRNEGGTLTQIKQGTTVGLIATDNCATFGGYGISTPSGSCSIPVQNIASSNIGATSATVTWTNQAGWLFNYIFIKLSGASQYTAVTGINGQYIEDTGFIFLNLLPNTNYDIMVIAQCVNGVQATPATITVLTSVQ